MTRPLRHALFLFCALAALLAATAAAAATVSKTSDRKYWAGIFFSLDDYVYATGDAEKLGFAKGGPKYASVEQAARDAFLQYRKGEQPYYEYFAKKKGRLAELWPTYVAKYGNTPEADQKMQDFLAEEIRSRHGRGAGALVVQIALKGTEFPVLYQIRILYGVGEYLAPGFQAGADIGFATPEGLEQELKRAVTEVMRSLPIPR